MKEYKIVEFNYAYKWASDGETTFNNDYTYTRPPYDNPTDDHRRFTEYVLNFYAKEGWNFTHYDDRYNWLFLEREV